MEQSCILSFPAPSAGRSCAKCWRSVSSSTEYCTPCRASTVSAICSRESRRGMYVGLLKDGGLEPIGLWSTMTTKSIIEIAETISVVARSSNDRHSCNRMYDCPLKSVFWDLKKEIDALATGTRGLCLDCIKAERKTIGLDALHLDKPRCQVDHGEGLTKI